MAVSNSLEELPERRVPGHDGQHTVPGQMRTPLVTSLEHLGTRATRENSTAPVRYEKRTREWPYDDATASNIEAEFSYLFPYKKENFIDKRFRETGRPQVILDWGCAKGIAAEEFGEKYEGKVVSLGYSMDSYEGWRDKKNATLIQSTADDLFDILRNAKQSIDLVYSRVGLGYLFPGASRTEQVPMGRGVQYIRRLLDFMNDGGVIAFDIGQQQSKEIVQALRDELAGRAEVTIDDQNLEGDYYIYITKLSLEELEKRKGAKDAFQIEDIRSGLGL